MKPKLVRAAKKTADQFFANFAATVVPKMAA
jgi:hypothetical protein